MNEPVLLGVDIGGTNTKLGIVTGGGAVLERGEFPTQPREGAEDVAARVRKWFETHTGAYSNIRSGGVACAGLLDSSRGFLHNSPNLPGWNGIDLAGIFSRELSLAVVVDNDVNCAAYGEFIKGAGSGVRYFACITLGTGVGGGIIMDGQLHRGFQGLAGEIGHTIIQTDGPPCTCGSRGCVEALIGASAIVDRFRGMLESGMESVLAKAEELTVRDISGAAEDGDATAIETLAATGRYLGIGLVNLAHLFNPEVIAIGGGVARAGDLILASARKEFSERVMHPIYTKTRIVPAELGNDASFIGAALLSQERKA
jgi:glucokinase